ncbi:hypothetical protein OIU78_010032 [Salix suchowensis]|nr:hypothetical protein OIU78_010032 [Salix suchowensis]
MKLWDLQVMGSCFHYYSKGLLSTSRFPDRISYTRPSLRILPSWTPAGRTGRGFQKVFSQNHHLSCEGLCIHTSQHSGTCENSSVRFA